MIFWKEYNLRFACSSCTKGHRSAKCSHLKRPLQEVKQKGRPASQCPSCRTKREIGQGHSHHKCKCGSNPPLNVVKKHNVVFDEGLELKFDPPSSFNMAIFQVRMNQKTPIELTVVMDKKDEEVVRLQPKEFKITEEEIVVKPTPNACQCHFGGNCICSSLPQERKRKPKVGQKQAGGCSCSGGCCSGGAKSCGPSCGCASGGSCGQPQPSNLALLQQATIPFLQQTTIPPLQDMNATQGGNSCCSVQSPAPPQTLPSASAGSCCSSDTNLPSAHTNIDVNYSSLSPSVTTSRVPI